MSQKSRSFDYKWIIVGVCILMGFMLLGFCSSNKSLYLAAITDALGFKRSLFSINDSCRFICMAMISLRFGYLLQRFGVRKMVFVGIVSLTISMLLYANSTMLLGFYIAGCFLGIGLALTTTTMISSILKHWCPTNTGKITGLALAANGLGGMVATQVVTPIIYEEGNPFGYQNAYHLVTLLVIVTGIIAVIFLRENPQNTAPIMHSKKSRGRNWIGIDFAAAKKKPFFYATIGCVFSVGMVLMGINGILAAHLQDVGLSPDYIAKLVSFQLILLTFSKFLAGVAYDRFGLRRTILICDFAAAATNLALMLITNSPAGRITAIIFAVSGAIALPLETVMISLITNDLFGDVSYDKFLGIFMAVNNAGYAVGGPVLNWCYDVFGSYRPMLFVFVCLMVAVTIVFQFVITASEKNKYEIMQIAEVTKH